MIRSIDMRAGVRDRLDLFHGPTQAMRPDEVFGLHAEEALHLLESVGVVTDVMDFGWQGFADSVVL